MNYWEILLLAIIQGLAELLPISSSAHVIVTARLLGIAFNPESPEGLFLLVMLHTGTMFAVLAYFWARWRVLLYPPEKPGEIVGNKLNNGFVWAIVIATFLTGVLGFGLKFLIEKVILPRATGQSGEIEQLFKNLPMIAVALASVGILMIFAGRRENKAQADNLTMIDSILIGLMQGLCLPFRGFSRSGATISTGLFCGLSRKLSEEFSFALAVVLTPAAIGYSLLKMLKETQWQFTGELWGMVLPGLVGMGFAFLAGLVALRFLSAVLESGRWSWFGYYCLLAAAGVVTVWWAKG